MSVDDEIRRRLSGDIPLPESTERRLAETYGIIRARAAKDGGKRTERRRLGVRAAMAALAAVILLCAGLFILSKGSDI